MAVTRASRSDGWHVAIAATGYGATRRLLSPHAAAQHGGEGPGGERVTRRATTGVQVAIEVHMVGSNGKTALKLADQVDAALPMPWA